jgi:hypothetical protein
MKKNLSVLLIVLLLVTAPMLIFAQHSSVPSCNYSGIGSSPISAGAPKGVGLEILLAIGVVYGLGRLTKEQNKKSSI